jgi:hypothetical protein
MSTQITGRTFGHDLSGLTGSGWALAVLLTPGTRRYRLEPPEAGAIQAWTHELRYARTGTVTSVEARNVVSAAAAAVRNIICPLVLDGFLPLPA